MSRAVTRLAEASPEERDLMRACASHRNGKHGPDQPRALRASLVLLEMRALAVYTAPRGWRLTAEGKRQAEIFRAAGRAANLAQKKQTQTNRVEGATS